MCALKRTRKVGWPSAYQSIVKGAVRVVSCLPSAVLSQHSVLTVWLLQVLRLISSELCWLR